MRLRFLITICLGCIGLLNLFGCSSGSNSVGSVTAPKRSVRPEDFGAVGDGVTDDTLALRNTVNSNQDIVLTTGKTYLVNGRITLKPGQKLNGNHATLKKGVQPAALTTSTPITANKTKTVTTDTPPTGYVVGMNIAFSQGNQANLVEYTSLSTNNEDLRITKIDGNVITLQNAPNATLSGTTDIHATYSTLRLMDGCSVTDLTIDGNRANWFWARWEITHEILITGNGCTVQNCHIQNAPGEGIVIYGTGNSVRDTQLNDLNGNGIHFTGTVHTVVDNVQVSNTNAVLAVGHQNGCVIASDNVDDTYIAHCTLSNGLTGIGSFDSPDNSNSTFTANSIYSCGAGIDVKKGANNSIITNNRIYNCATRTSGISVQLEVVGAAQVMGNQCYNCGILVSSRFSTSNQVPTGVQCTNNHIENGDLYVGSINKSSVSQNTIVQGELNIVQSCDSVDISGNSIDNTGNTTLNGIEVQATNVTNLTIQGNNIAGGSIGILYGHPNQTNLSVRNNLCSGQLTTGIFSLRDNTAIGNTIQGNQVVNSLPSTTAWEGIVSGCPQALIGQNQISSRNGLTAHYGIRVVNSPSVVDSNQVLGSYDSAAVRVTATCIGAIVKNNTLNAGIVDNGTGTVLINNTITPP